MMWTAIQLLTCATIILAVSFFVGKRIGQRRFIKMQEEMKALEKSFNQLLEQMELVSGHNLQVLDNKTQELRELLNVVDKKCLYATDLMKEVDEMKRRLQNHNRTAEASAAPAPVTEIKLRREMQEMQDETNGHIQTIDIRIVQLEQEQQEVFQQLLSIKKASLASERVIQDRQASAPPPPDLARMEAPACEIPPETAPAELAIDVSSPPESLSLGSPSVIDRIRHRPRPALDSMQYEIVQQVLELHDQGVSIPQIARQMKMSKTEVELMMKFYDMRKAG